MVYRYPDIRYGTRWNARRWAIFGAMGYTCSLCKKYSKGDLHLHHIVPIGCGGSNSSNNLAPLCSGCHEFVHSGNYHGPLLVLKNYKGFGK